jgi:heptosyltransferase-2
VIPPDHTIVDRLVIRPPNWLGDAVLALPAMVALRHHFKDASITIAATSAVAALFREDTGVNPDAVLVLPKPEKDAVRAIADGKFELGILFPNSFHSAWQLRRAGVPQRWGYSNIPRGWVLTRKALRSSHRALRTHLRQGFGGQAPHSARQHHADFYKNLVRGLGIPCDDDAPHITTSPQALNQAQKQIGLDSLDAARIITLAPGAAYGQAKQWPPTRVAELVARLIRDRDVVCVLVGATHDREAGRTIESWLRANAAEVLPRVKNLIGQTDLGTLVAITSSSRVCVTNDSGVMHVAAATGRPVVAMFGPTDERVTRPLGRGDVLTADVFCRPCHLRDCPIDHRCMKRITVDQVFAAVSRHLAFTPSGPR